MSEPHEPDLSHLKHVQYVKSPTKGWTWVVVEFIDDEPRTLERAGAFFPTLEEASQDYKER